ncbi:hypothetical protein [Leeia sp.]|uniref:hypothetical protein n=1 Tax=Leeia sp. TaxID=2884678 RepID=UPI0035AE8BFB
MNTVEQAYQQLTTRLTAQAGVSAGQMFGKACLKINGKAFIALHKDTVVFKLNGPTHASTLALADAVLWDPSGKDRPMKEWIALSAQHSAHFPALADAALAYVQPSR